MLGLVGRAYRTRNRSCRGLGPTGKAMPALALERVAGCAPRGTLAPCLDRRTHHSRRIYAFTNDSPHRLVRFKEESDLPWADLNRRLGTDPHTVKALEG